LNKRENHQRKKNSREIKSRTKKKKKKKKKKYQGKKGGGGKAVARSPLLFVATRSSSLVEWIALTVKSCWIME
jgi:hypothetical protein